MEGQQYIGFTPGDVHAKRWGTDTVQFRPDPENPRVMQWISQPESAKASRGTALENLQQNAEDPLAYGDNPRVLNLDDPDIDAQLRQIVEQKLSYGLYDYPYPDEEIARRATRLKKQMEKSAASGKASHVSPRAEGSTLAYAPIEEYYAKLLRRLGSKREIQDIIPGQLRGFEIDPEVAQAVKRGLPLPY
jgi:hypothetical protein